MCYSDQKCIYEDNMQSQVVKNHPQQWNLKENDILGKDLASSKAKFMLSEILDVMVVYLLLLA